MAMTMTHVHQLLEANESKEHRTKERIGEIGFKLPMGVGAVDPVLVEPRDGQEGQPVEELIAFRCSCL